MEVTKGTIKIKSSTGEEMEHSFTIPKEVANDIICQLLEWKDNYYFTPKDYENYIENKINFEVVKESKK